MVPITTGFKQTPTNLVSVRVRLYLFPDGCPAGRQSDDLLPSAKPPAFRKVGGGSAQRVWSMFVAMGTC